MSKISTREKIKEGWEKKVGLRALLKSMYLSSKNSSSKGFRYDSFLVSGNAFINLGQKTTIINNGTINLGLSKNSLPSRKQTILKMFEGSKLVVQEKFSVSPGVTITLGEDSVLDVGNAFINSDSKISCWDRITIGKHVIVGWDVDICDSDLHYIVSPDFRVSMPIIIGNNIWIGSRSIILKGVKINDGAVIGAGSIVTHEVPKNCLVAGVPAKVVKENVSWSETEPEKTKLAY